MLVLELEPIAWACGDTRPVRGERHAGPRNRSIGHGHRDGIAVGCWSWGRLGRHTAINAVALRCTVAGRRDRVGTNRIAPDGGPAAVAVERVIDGIGAGAHFSDGDGRTCSGTCIEPNIEGRCIGALDLQRGCLVNVGKKHALAAEIERRGTVDRARRYNSDLRRKGRRGGGRKRRTREWKKEGDHDGKF